MKSTSAQSEGVIDENFIKDDRLLGLNLEPSECEGNTLATAARSGLNKLTFEMSATQLKSQNLSYAHAQT